MIARRALPLLQLAAPARADMPDWVAPLRRGGFVLYMRHGVTDRSQVDTGRLGDRAAQRGEVAQTNPWSQLAPASYRSAVTQIEQHQRVRASKPDTSTDEDE